MLGVLAAGVLLASSVGVPEVTTVVSDIEASGGVSIGPDGQLYVADFGSSLRSAGGANIYRITPDGTQISVISDAFGGASGNSFGEDGFLYQSDVARGEIFRVSRGGERTKLADGLTSPVGIVRASDGTVYVTECVADAITMIAVDGTKRRIAEGEPLNCPNGLAIAPDGNLYTVNFRNGALVRIDLPSGTLQEIVRIPGGGNGHLDWANNRFYIASYSGHRIYSAELDGKLCLIAGNGHAANADGPGLEASLYRPNGIAVTADGDLLYTNTISTVAEPQSPVLHPNAVRQVNHLRTLLECPAERRVEAATGAE